MKIALVAMPWPHFDAPSAALGALSAYVKKERPGDQVVCLHPYISLWQQMEGLYETLSQTQEAEFFFIPHLYPKQKEAVSEYFKKAIDKYFKKNPQLKNKVTSDQIYQQFLLVSDQLITNTVEQLKDNFDVVGFTVTYAQLFASIAVAQKLKKAKPKIKIVFGGAGVDGDCGESIFKEYSCIDYLVQGEGEKPFLELLNSLEKNKQKLLVSCVLERNNKEKGQKEFKKAAQDRLQNQIANLNSLPEPDYDDFYKLADALNIYWQIPIETSRGCWWNTRLTTHNFLKGCYFCNLNVGSYREKDPQKVANEIKFLTKKYKNLRLKFMDNVMRKHGLVDMIDAVKKLNMDLRFITEVRASIKPYELVSLWEAGCFMLQIGIEGFSTAYLKRMGKGSSTILNLQTLKTCCELGIASGSNVLAKFPGATQEEVDEMAYNMEHYAINYEPTEISEFCLYMNAPVCVLPERFGVTHIRNSKPFCDVLPEDVFKRLKVFWQDFEEKKQQADWSKIYEVKDKWKSFKSSLQPLRTFTTHPLFYTDGGDFLEIVDRREGFRLILLEEEWYTVYKYCMEIKSFAKVCEYMKKSCAQEKVKEVLDAFVAEKLMFTEQNKYLSLAVAASPLMAARRIKLAR